MNRIVIMLILFFAIAGCGPREIGQDTSSYEDEAGTGDIAAAEQMRKPMTGATKTEFMLYQYNRPETMYSIKSAQYRWLRHHGAISPEDPAYRETPREKSPFVQ